MYKFNYESQGTTTYLVYQIGAEDMIDDTSLGMLRNNDITGVAPILFNQINNDRFLMYNISAKRPVSSFLMDTVTKRSLLSVFLGIANAFICADEYMIDTSLFILDLDYIFVDVTTCETLVVCLPILSETNKQVSLQQFFKNIMLEKCFDQTENIDYVGKLMSYLNGKGIFSIHDFSEMVYQLLNEQSQAQPQYQKANHQTVQPSVEQPVRPAVNQQQIQMQPQTVSPVQPISPPQPTVSNIKPNIHQPASAQPTGFAVPQQPSAAPIPINSKGIPNNIPQKVTEPVDLGEEISLLDLLKAYNPERAALYKAQKAQKKAAKGKSAAPKATVQANAPIPMKQVAPQTNVPQKTPAMSGAASVQQPVQQQVQQQAQQSAMQNNPSPILVASNNYGGTTVLNDYSQGTTVLSEHGANQQTTPYLTRVKNNEKTMITTHYFRIGKERSQVEYFIGDNTNISRNHADIIMQDGDYFIKDIGSTNGTFINNSRIIPHTLTKLNNGDKIRLANEEFEFRLN